MVLLVQLRVKPMTTFRGKIATCVLLIGMLLALATPHAQLPSTLRSEADSWFRTDSLHTMELAYLVESEGNGRTRCRVGVQHHSAVEGPPGLPGVRGEARWRIFATKCPSDGPGACSEVRTLTGGTERWETDEDGQATFDLPFRRDEVRRELGDACCAYLAVKIDRIVPPGEDPLPTASVTASCSSLDRLEFE